MTRLFLDCEWADNNGRDLVSLALVSEDCVHQFYSEVSPLPKHPTEFVRLVVYPLLEHGYYSRQKIEITRDLRLFLAGIPQPCVFYDHPADGGLLRCAIDGFGLPHAALAHFPPAPPYREMLVAFGDVRTRIEEYFEARPIANARRHHARVDAEALRWAFEGTLDENLLHRSWPLL